jgi:hypothetical protein
VGGGCMWCAGVAVMVSMFTGHHNTALEIQANQLAAQVGDPPEFPHSVMPLPNSGMPQFADYRATVLGQGAATLPC